MIGQVLVDASRLLAIRDALVLDDKMEVYHQLRMIVDPTNRVALANDMNHWAELEAIASAALSATDRPSE